MNDRTISALAALTLAAAACTPARADVVYSYSGNPFTDFMNDGSPPATYGPADAVSVQLVLPGPIGDNWVQQSVSPAVFTASDGLNTIDQTNADPIRSQFRIWTDSTGEITQWAIDIFLFESGSRYSLIETVNTPSRTVSYVQDGGVQFYEPTYMSSGGNSGSPGVWSVSSIPEPASWAILLIGFLGLGAALRGKRALIA